MPDIPNYEGYFNNLAEERCGASDRFVFARARQPQVNVAPQRHRCGRLDRSRAGTQGEACLSGDETSRRLGRPHGQGKSAGTQDLASDNPFARKCSIK